jgi:uncharacterized metal-binding protein
MSDPTDPTSNAPRHSLPPRCAACEDHRCRGGTDCFGVADRIRFTYGEAGETAAHLSASAAHVEATGYCQWPRALEIARFAEHAGLYHLGVAYCIGVTEEARRYAAWLEPRFRVSSVCCKVGGIPKAESGLPHVRPHKRREVQCSPLGQAHLLNEAGTELNIALGLCVGHDALFTQASEAPVTTLLVKDRVLAHNPAGALYSGYWHRMLGKHFAG